MVCLGKRRSRGFERSVLVILSKGFNESYKEDMKLFQTIWVKVWLCLFLALLLFFPFMVDPYVTSLANISGFAIIGAMGLNILTGCTGQISLGHAAFMAIGSYTVAILAATFHISFWIALPLAGIISARTNLPRLKISGSFA